jgi:hypothetical protein
LHFYNPFQFELILRDISLREQEVYSFTVKEYTKIITQALNNYQQGYDCLAGISLSFEELGNMLRIIGGFLCIMVMTING